MNGHLRDGHDHFPVKLTNHEQKLLFSNTKIFPVSSAITKFLFMKAQTLCEYLIWGTLRITLVPCHMRDYIQTQLSFSPFAHFQTKKSLLGILGTRFNIGKFPFYTKQVLVNTLEENELPQRDKMFCCSLRFAYILTFKYRQNALSVYTNILSLNE